MKFAWIRSMLRARRIQLLSLQQEQTVQISFDQIFEQNKYWIESQIKWLKNTIQKQHRWDKILLLSSIISFFVTLVSSFLYSLGLLNVGEIWTESGMAITAALLGYRELLGLSDTNARYARSQSGFQRASNALKILKSHQQNLYLLRYRKKLVVEAIGNEKIDELNDWVGDQLQRSYNPGG